MAWRRACSQKVTHLDGNDIGIDFAVSVAADSHHQTASAWRHLGRDRVNGASLGLSDRAIHNAAYCDSIRFVGQFHLRNGDSVTMLLSSFASSQGYQIATLQDRF